MKRKLFLALSIVALLVLPVALTVFAASDIEQHRDCKHCGMDRKAFGYSRMLVEYKDGTQVGTCSLQCIVAELENNKGGEVASIKVADRGTQQLLDAKKAIWVIGGKKRGVMTPIAKWAFATREAAEKFVTEFGGNIATFDEALRSAQKGGAERAKSWKSR
ncbi:MAG: nitrous oxide reductase accessory protein NosL [Desulfuromonadaceae bacterium]|nr:nitrous oxide reductase accessory protein NosL [Desulfuromonadaceae bacterium]MDD5106325.1 nitrous oxide reductase accessory protein NosL [Desulfuromonadaceae bacterium]